MSKTKDYLETTLVVLVVGAISLAVLYLIGIGLRGFWRSIEEPAGYYCSSLKKIVQADPIFEDDGKYEDESYRVTYEDGSIGLVDDATLRSGYYCVSEDWMRAKTANERGWVLKP